MTRVRRVYAVGPLLNVGQRRKALVVWPGKPSQCKTQPIDRPDNGENDTFLTENR